MSNKKLEEKWKKDCLRYGDRVLTGKYAHYCWDWDELPIDETVPEFKVCTCFHKSYKEKT